VDDGHRDPSASSARLLHHHRRLVHQDRTTPTYP
jgi:hypothetical protein